MYQKERVAVYIDGHNLAHGLKEAGWRKYYWLDVCQLASSLMKPEQSIAFTKYFTAEVVRNDEKTLRQRAYLGALEAQNTPDTLSVVYGRFQLCEACSKCGYPLYAEKETDVNIATSIVADAAANVAEAILLVSGDSDQVPPLRIAREQFNKVVIVAFPPKRVSAYLERIAHRSFVIGPGKLIQSQMPQYVKKDGRTFSRPQKWG